MDRIGANIIYVDRRASEDQITDVGVDDGVASSGTPSAEIGYLKQSIRVLKDAFGDSMSWETSVRRSSALTLLSSTSLLK